MLSHHFPVTLQPRSWVSVWFGLGWFADLLFPNTCPWAAPGLGTAGLMAGKWRRLLRIPRAPFPRDVGSPFPFSPLPSFVDPREAIFAMAADTGVQN